MARPILRGPKRGPVRRRRLAAVVASTPVSNAAAARAAAIARHERLAGTVLELDLDKCKLNFGTTNEFGTCTATGEKCTNTFKTCKDTVNYRKGTYTWKFCTRGMRLPAGDPMRPYVLGIAIAPAEIDPSKGLAVRSHTTITLEDEPCPDNEGDPYIAGRAMAATGTFWTRLLARTKNAAGRPARLRRGFITEPWSWDTFQTEHYIVETIRGPDRQGRFSVELSDTIRLLDRTQIPVATDGKLAADLPAVSNSGTAQSGTSTKIRLAATASAVDDFYNGQEVLILQNTGAGQRRVILDYAGATRDATVAAWSVNPDSTSTYEVVPLKLTLDAGKGSQYPDPAGTGGREFVRSGDEVIRYTGRTGDVLSWTDGTHRAQFGTTRADHNIDAGVQLCRAWFEAPPETVVQDIQNEGGMPDAFIDLSGLAAEAADWLSIGALITACISAPEKASDLLKDVLIDLNLLCWWDPVAQLVRFKSDMPALGSTLDVFTDDELVEGATQADALDAERITRAAIYYDPRAATLNLKEPKNFARAAVQIDLDAESGNEYGDVRPEVRYSRWFSANNSNFARARVARLLGRRRDAPVRLKFQLDPRNEMGLGELMEVTSRALVDKITGAPTPVRMRVTKKNDRLTHLEMEARSTNLGRRYFFIGPAALPDYGSASAAERQYGYISDANGLMSDGSTGYAII